MSGELAQLPEKLKANTRIVQKNMIYLIGLSSGLANKDLLVKKKYLGQYGTIIKVVVNRKHPHNPKGPRGPSFSAYVSFSSPEEAAVALLAVDNRELDGHLVRASFGTSKYCSYFLKQMACPKKNCLYLHSASADDQLVQKDKFSLKSKAFVEQHKIAVEVARLSSEDVAKRLKASRGFTSDFPETASIYSRKTVIQKIKSDSDNMAKAFERHEDLQEGEEEVKYILVKETKFSRRNRRRRTNNFDTDLLERPKFKFGSESTSAEKSVERVESNHKQDIQPTHLTFAETGENKKIKSRFGFSLEEKPTSQIEVPEFIQKLIYKKFICKFYFRNSQSAVDGILLRTALEANPNSKWSEFLRENLPTAFD